MQLLLSSSGYSKISGLVLAAIGIGPQLFGRVQSHVFNDKQLYCGKNKIIALHSSSC